MIEVNRLVKRFGPKVVLRNLDKLPGLDEAIVVYCGSGHRGGMITAALRLLGYTNVRNLNGGFGAWKKANLAVVTGQDPAAPTAKSTAIIADEALYKMLDGFLATLPDGFYALKPAAVSEALGTAAAAAPKAAPAIAASCTIVGLCPASTSRLNRNRPMMSAPIPVAPHRRARTRRPCRS